MKSSMKRLASLPLMLIFTLAGFIVLAVSVILMTVESLILPLLSQAPSSKTETKKKSFTQAQLHSREPQVCSRTRSLQMPDFMKKSGTWLWLWYLN